jgi:hypothetical protein
MDVWRPRSKALLPRQVLLKLELVEIAAANASLA